MQFQKLQWCDDAERGLSRTFGKIGRDQFRAWVEAGECELWRVDGDSFLITESRGEILWVWCYQGRNARGLTEALQRIGRKNACSVVQFQTYRAAFLRMLEPYGIALIDRGDENLLICEIPT